MALFGRLPTWRDDILMSKIQLRRFRSTVNVFKGSINWGAEPSLCFPMAQQINNLLAMQKTQETQVWSLGQEDPLEEENGNPLSRVRLFTRLAVEPTRLLHPQGFSRWECWSWLPFPSSGNLPAQGPTSLMFPALAGGFFATSATWETKAIRVLIIFHCVQTSFWWFGGEATEWCSGIPVLSSKWLSPTLVRTSVPTEKLKGICVFLEEELGSCPKATLLFLECASFEAFPPFPDKQLFEYALWSSGKVRKLKKLISYK